MVSTKASCLRVALIQSHRIIEDRTFLEPSRVSIGRALENTFVVPSDASPERRVLFEVRRGRYELAFDDGAEGSLSVLGAEARPLSELGQRPVPLDATARGRVRVGDLVVLFQFVPRPETTPPLKLPRALRGSLLAQVDRAFLMVLGLSLLGHFAAAGWLAAQPMPVEPEEILEPLDRFAAQAPLARPQAPPPPAPTRAVPAASRGAQPERTVARAEPPSRAALSERVRHLGLLGAVGQGNDAVLDVLGDREPDVVGGALAGARGPDTVGRQQLDRRGGEVGERVDVALETTQPTHAVALHERQAAGPKIDVERPKVDGPELSPAKLSAWLKTRMPVVQACYERELKRAPTLRGRLEVRFNITPQGRVQDVEFPQDDLHSRGVVDCITSSTRGWLLREPPENEVSVSCTWVFAPTS